MMRTTLTLARARIRTGNQAWPLATVTVQRVKLRSTITLLTLLRGELGRELPQGTASCRFEGPAAAVMYPSRNQAAFCTLPNLKAGCPLANLPLRRGSARQDA